MCEYIYINLYCSVYIKQTAHTHKVMIQECITWLFSACVNGKLKLCFS